MWREQGKIKPAIALYRGILARRPDLLYVRLNLAAMLYQDRQFEAAADQFRKIAADDALDTPARSAVNQYLAVIQKQQKWRYDVGLNYEHTDNVNNASSDRFIWVNGNVLALPRGCVWLRTRLHCRALPTASATTPTWPVILTSAATII